MLSLHNIQLMLEFLTAPFLVYIGLLYINDLPDDVICNISICADDTTVLSILSVIRHLIYGNNKD